MDWENLDEPTMILNMSDEKDRKCSMHMGVASILGTRKNQQDTAFGEAAEDWALAVVCDGMGGMNGGEMASQTAVKMLVEDFFSTMPFDHIPAFFAEEAEKMNDAVRGLVDNEGNPLNGGTTVVAAVVKDNQLYWLSVGDSKIYLIRDNEIVSVNREHNLRLMLDEKLKNGEITEEEYKKEERQAEALISFLGIEELTLLDINPNPFLLKENDIVLLCSDGLYKTLPEKEIAETVFYEEPDMERAAKRLVDVVHNKAKLTQDNTSVVIMQYNVY